MPTLHNRLFASTRTGGIVALAIGGLAALQLASSAWLFAIDSADHDDAVTIAQLNHVTNDLLQLAQLVAFDVQFQDEQPASTLSLVEHLDNELTNTNLSHAAPWSERLAIIHQTIKKLGRDEKVTTLRANAQPPTITTRDGTAASELLQHIEPLLAAMESPIAQAPAGGVLLRRVTWKMRNMVVAEAALLASYIARGNGVTEAMRADLRILQARTSSVWETLKQLTETIPEPPLHQAIDGLHAQYDVHFSSLREHILASAPAQEDAHAMTQNEFVRSVVVPTMDALDKVFNVVFVSTEEYATQKELDARDRMVKHGLVLVASMLFAGILLVIVHRGALAPLRRLQTLLQTAVDGIITIDERGIVQSFNAAAERIFGYTAEEVCGKNISMLMPEPDASAHNEYLSRYLRSGQARILGIGREVNGRRRDGTVFPLRLAVGKANGSGKQFFTGIVRDLSQEKAAEQMLRDREEMLRAIGDNIPSGAIFQLTEYPDGTRRFNYISHGIETLCGVQATAVLADPSTLLKFFCPEDQNKLRIAEQSADHVNIESCFHLNGGLQLWIQWIAAARRLPDGSTVWDGLLLNISQRKVAEQRLAEELAFSQGMLAASVFGISVYETNGQCVYPNQKMARIIGAAEEQVLAQNFRLLPSWSNSGLLPLAEQALTEGKQCFTEFYVTTSFGKTLWLEAYFVPFERAGARHLLLAVYDITARKHSELIQSRQKALLNVLRNAMTHFVEFSDQQLTYQYLLNSVLELTDSRYGFVAEVLFDSRDDPYLRTRAITDISWNDATRRLFDNSRQQGLEFRNLSTLFGAALTSGKPVISNDPSHDPRHAGLPPGHPPLDAFLGVPIFHGGKLIGMYGIANRVDGYDEELLEFLRPFTSTCGILIQAMRTANERLAYQQNLALAKDAAEAANRAKSQFLSSMSHELRTPLNVMLGFAQLLKMDAKSPLNTDQQSEVEQVLKAGWHLLELINGVLDLAKIEAGRLDLSLEPIDVSLLINECADFMSALAVQKNIVIHNKVSLRAGPAINADQTRFKQVLLNLMSNALKYNHRGGAVTITAQTDNGRVRISVEDTGQGLTNEQQQHLFQPFNRLGMEGGNIEGTGIGLVISKRLIEMMGGIIGVDSEAGKGSTFWLEMPVVDLPAPTAIDDELAPAAGETQTPPPCTVLYIEDNASNIKLITQVLRRRPTLTLLTAETGTAGLASARSQRPDVILLDINLPDLDGFAVKEQLQAYDETKNIPVIAISANAMPANIDHARQAGFVDYVTKPFDVSHLFALLDSALNHRPRGEGVPQHPSK